jgi:hypothetical protein
MGFALAGRRWKAAQGGESAGGVWAAGPGCLATIQKFENTLTQQVRRIRHRLLQRSARVIFDQQAFARQRGS